MYYSSKATTLHFLLSLAFVKPNAIPSHRKRGRRRALLVAVIGGGGAWTLSLACLHCTWMPPGFKHRQESQL